MRAHHDVAGLAPPYRADHVAQTARHRLEAPVGQQVAQLLGQLARSGRARRAGAELHLCLQKAPGGLRIEAVDHGTSRGGVIAVVAIREGHVVGRNEPDQPQAEQDLYGEHASEKLHQRDCGG